MSVKIDSYEPYHIGMKINPTLAADAVSLRYKLLTAFKSKNVEKDVSRLSGNEILKKTKNERVELNYDVFALNTVGTGPRSTLKMYRDVVSRIKDLNYEIDGFAAFHEIVSNINIKVPKNPTDILNKLSKLNLDAFESMAKLETTGVRIGIPENKNEVFNILLEVNPLNPQSMLVMRLLYRNNNNQRVVELSEKIESMIHKFMSSVVKVK